MSTASVSNDGPLIYGSRLETINRPTVPGASPLAGSPLSGSYVFESISISRKTKKISRYDETGGPSGKVIIPDFVEGSGTVQLLSSATTLRAGDYFTDTFDAGIGAEVFVISEVDQPESQNEIKKVSVKLDKRYNS